jgi:hypothetical protein
LVGLSASFFSCFLSAANTAIVAMVGLLLHDCATAKCGQFKQLNRHGVPAIRS